MTADGELELRDYELIRELQSDDDHDLEVWIAEREKEWALWREAVAARRQAMTPEQLEDERLRQIEHDMFIADLCDPEVKPVPSVNWQREGF
jgi:hypothetical protein